MIVVAWILAAISIAPLIAYHVWIWLDARREKRRVIASIRRSREQSRKAGLL